MLHKSTKTLVIIANSFLFACLIGLLIFYVVGVQQKELYAEYSKEHVEGLIREKEIAKIESVLEETQVARNALHELFLKEEEVIEFLSLVETIGREQGLVLETNSLNVEAIDADFETLIIKVETEGTYQANMRVLKTLELLPYQSETRNVVFTREGEGRQDVWSGTYEIRVTKYVKGV